MMEMTFQNFFSHSLVLHPVSLQDLSPVNNLTEIPRVVKKKKKSLHLSYLAVHASPSLEGDTYFEWFMRDGAGDWYNKMTLDYESGGQCYCPTSTSFL